MCQLTIREITEIVERTIRANRRHNEHIMGSSFSVDRMFQFLRDRNIVLTDEQWNTLERYMDYNGGENMVHQETAEVSAERMSQLGLPAEIAEVTRDYIGGIYMNIDVIANIIDAFQHVSDLSRVAPEYRIYAMHRDELPAHYAQRFTLFLLIHERRHSCQQWEDIIADYDGVIDPDELAERHDAMACEIDANNFGSFHTSDPMGMYYNAF